MKITGCKRRVIQMVLIAAGLAMMTAGIRNGEAQTVLGKAINICLECIGIG